MTKSNKTIFAGLGLMAVLISTSVVYETAFAQEFDRERQLSERPLHMGTFLVGSGAAVSEENQPWRSHFKMGLVEVETEDNGHAQYDVKRGVFAVGKHDQRQIFSVISDTWQVSVSPNEKSFDASGEVENQDGLVYEIEISGDEISDLENGSLYFVSGTATGNGEVYELFYISGLIDRTTVQATSSGI
ncbi:MAG: hypothetical protein R3237_00020 [Nitrosopumilaceae archaeon]|nr:hypothetical protein [Nitrosopumilaceae archaeon]